MGQASHPGEVEGTGSGKSPGGSCPWLPATDFGDLQQGFQGALLWVSWGTHALVLNSGFQACVTEAHSGNISYPRTQFTQFTCHPHLQAGTPQCSAATAPVLAFTKAGLARSPWFHKPPICLESTPQCSCCDVGCVRAWFKIFSKVSAPTDTPSSRVSGLGH